MQGSWSTIGPTRHTWQVHRHRFIYKFHKLQRAIDWCLLRQVRQLQHPLNYWSLSSDYGLEFQRSWCPTIMMSAKGKQKQTSTVNHWSLAKLNIESPSILGFMYTCIPSLEGRLDANIASIGSTQKNVSPIPKRSVRLQMQSMDERSSGLH